MAKSSRFPTTCLFCKGMFATASDCRRSSCLAARTSPTLLDTVQLYRHNEKLKKLPGYGTYVNWMQSVNAPVANLSEVNWMQSVNAPVANLSEFPLELHTALQELHQPTPGKRKGGGDFTLPEDVLERAI